jgi:hypothetical protein
VSAAVRRIGPRRITWRTTGSHALTLLGGIFGAFYWAQLTTGGGQPSDASAYYHVQLDNMYGSVVGANGAYLYAPVFAQLVAVLRVLPFEAFVAVWRAAAILVVVRLAGPLTLPVLFLAPVASDINAGNINVFLAGAIALGLSRPGGWAFVLLTKVTPGVGLLWFAVRREWKSLRTAALVSLVVFAVSFVLAPGQWLAWFDLLRGHLTRGVPTFPYYVPLVVRLPLAAITVYFAARLGQRWIVPIAAMIAAPILFFPTQSIALGALPFIRGDVERWFDRTRARLNSGRTAAPPAPVGKPADSTAEGEEVPVEILR